MATYTFKDKLTAPRVRKRHFDLLEKLSNACGTSGNEDEIRRIVIDELKRMELDYTIDSIGNILVEKKGTGRNRLQVLLAAHMDEIGFMIVESKDGFLTFAKIGGIDDRQLPGKEVLVGPEKVRGVIGSKAIHLTSPEERKKSIPLSTLKIDVGAENAGKCKAGQWAVFSTEMERFAGNMVGKAFDDRLGILTCLIMLEDDYTNIDLQVAFTVQEEIGLRGARVAAYHFNPDIAIALDCTPALDMPTWDDEENTLYRSRAGHGPAIYVGDGRTLADPRLVAYTKAVAAEYKIPYQVRQPGAGGTDAGEMHLQREGIPAMSISAPGRYLHTAATLVKEADWKNEVRLVSAMLHNFTPNLLKNPR